MSLLIAARALHFAATISLVGIFVWECLVAGPALFRAPIGASPRLQRQLAWFAWGSLGLAMVSGAAWLVGIAAEMSGKPLTSVLVENVWTVVLTRTRFGTDWLARFGLLALLACCLLIRQRAESALRGWLALLFAALLVASLAWAGHGGATPGPPGYLHLAADILHLLGAGVWLGTLIPLVLFLGEIRRLPHLVPIAGAVVRRFSVLAVISVPVVFAAGLVNTWFLAGSAPALLGTLYGRLLLAKIALFIAMLMFAAVNLLRLTPRLEGADGRGAAFRAITWLRGNALIEAVLGMAILGIVGALGILPPGLHMEPGWPLPFRIELAVLGAGAKIALALLIAACCGCAIGAVMAAAAARYRRMAVFAASIVPILCVGWVLLNPAVERAYPTSFYAPAEPYAAASIVRGEVLYAENCALCHGASGHGDGPAAAGMKIRPADLTEPHLFAHSPGDLYWWIGHGRDNGAMPGFAAVLKPDQRWDIINFIRARAAGTLASETGPQVTAAAGLAFPDFAFEAAGVQGTLAQALESGPVLLMLFVPPAPTARLAALAASQQVFERAGLRLLAVAIGPTERGAEESKAALPPFVVEVSPEIITVLALFRAPGDGRETELLLDPGGNIRARWTDTTAGGLPDPATLIADANEAARVPPIAPSHAH